MTGYTDEKAKYRLTVTIKNPAGVDFNRRCDLSAVGADRQKLTSNVSWPVLLASLGRLPLDEKVMQDFQDKIARENRYDFGEILLGEREMKILVLREAAESS
jgi:hypothetical protein